MATSRVIGREREQQELGRLLADAVAGQGAVVVVDGDAGVGKTALARALADAARDEAAPIWVTCGEHAAAVPRRVLELTLAELGAPPPREDCGLVELADTFTRAIVTAQPPRLVLVDDIQWADEVSLQVLALAAPRVHEAPVLLVATLRTGEPMPAHARAPVLALMRAARRVPVLALDDDAATMVVQAAVTRDLSARVRQRIVAQARGNPLFLRELALLASGDETGFLHEHHVPSTVRSVLDRRLATLDGQTRTALERLAICGDDITFPLASAVLGSTTDDLLRLAESASEAGVLQPATGARLRFAHPLIRDAVSAGIPYHRRVKLHQDIGAQLLALAESGVDVDVAMLAHHLCAAAPAGGGTLAVAWAVRAAREAAARLAYGAAADWYARASDALDATGPELGHTDPFELLLWRGEALEAAGDQPEARAAFRRAFDLARARGDAEGMGRSALGLAGGSGFEIAVGDSTHLSVLDTAIAALEDGSLRAMLLARRSIAAALQEPPQRRQSSATDALALARRAGDDAAECAALAALCDAMSGPAHVNQRRDLATELVRLAEGSPDPRPLLLGLRLLAVAQLELGDIAAFDRTVDRYEVAADRIRQPLYDWYVPLWRGVRRAMEADVEATERLANQAEAIGLAAGSGNALLLVECLRTFLAIDIGDTARLDVFEGAELPGLIEPWLAISNAYINAAKGNLAAARAVADRLPQLLARVPEDSEYLPTLVQAARVVAWLGGPTEVASLLYDRLEPYQALFVVEGIGAYVHGPVRRFLALLAGVLGRPGSAEHTAAARDAATAVGATLVLRLLDAAGQPPPAVADDAGTHGVLRRSGDGWVIALGDARTYVRDSKGMRDLATLVARPRAEVAVLQLAGRVEATSRGDVMLDEQARTAYRNRLSAIDAEIEEAQANADLGRLDRAQFEREFLIAELTAASGLHGRPRRVGDDVERARTAVTARLRDAIRRIDHASPTLGEHFRRSVRTGVSCSYDPPIDVRWNLTL